MKTNNQIFKEYDKIQRRINELEGKKSILKEVIERDLGPAGEKLDFGVFFWKTNKTWIYSEKIIKSEIKLKSDKMKEQEKGVAKFKESKSMNYKPVYENI